jgi:hypothetical protein
MRPPSRGCRGVVVADFSLIYLPSTLPLIPVLEVICDPSAATGCPGCSGGGSVGDLATDGRCGAGGNPSANSRLALLPLLNKEG